MEERESPRLAVHINKIVSSSQPDRPVWPAGQGTHSFRAEARESRTHLFRISGTHAALKAGRDTGPHPPPLKTRKKKKDKRKKKNTKYKIQNTKTYTLYRIPLYLYTAMPLFHPRSQLRLVVGIYFACWATLL